YWCVQLVDIHQRTIGRGWSPSDQKRRQERGEVDGDRRSRLLRAACIWASGTRDAGHRKSGEREPESISTRDHVESSFGEDSLIAVGAEASSSALHARA